MSNAAANLFMERLETRDIKAAQPEENVITFGISMKNINVKMGFIFSEDCANVAVRASFTKVSDEQYGKALQICNLCNSRFRWVKFVIDPDDNEIKMEEDAFIQLDSCADECEELMAALLSIADEAYPQFMKALWSD